MQDSVLTQVILPLVLGFIMYGMGLSLTKEDFQRLFKMPKSIFVGFTGQIILMPSLAFLVAKGFNLSTELAIGIMILAACPGGTMSNVISHLARANLALSVTLTAISTVVCVFSTPWIIQFAISQFSETPITDFSLVETSIGLFFVTLLPVFLGILTRQKWPFAAMRWEAFFRRFSMAFMVIMIVAIMIQERDVLLSSFSQVFLATLALNIGAVVLGILLGMAFKLIPRDIVTLGIEVGIQNASMAMLIAITFLNSPGFATSAGVYGVTMYLGGMILLFGARLIDKRELQRVAT